MEPIIGQPQAGADAGQPAGDIIKDSDAGSFAQDVLDGSMQVPVIVDFWAPWCGPCKQLGPMLEKLVKEAKGAVRLVKVNVDENQEIAQQLRIQSIPTVYAFFQGRPVDGFTGALPESQLRQFIDKLKEMGGGEQQGQDALEQALEQAAGALEAGETGAASSLYGQVLQRDPQNAAAIAGLMRCHVANGDPPGAREIYDGLDDEMKAHGEIASALAAVELAEETAQAAGDIADLEEKVAHSPDDLQARYDLALALNAAGKREAACEELLEIIGRNRAWNDEAARRQLVKFFEAWGPGDPVTQSARRRLSALLFS